MSSISVKEAAIKFGLSERRVQKLCEENRIEGAKRISGVWIIPENAEKPQDGRTNSVRNLDNGISLAEACSQLGISLASGKNWVRLGKLVPSSSVENHPFFDEQYIQSLKKELETGLNKSLKSRRNKKYVSGRQIYNSYVTDNCRGVESVSFTLNIIDSESIILNEELLNLIVANAAIQMISKRFYQKQLFLIDYLNNQDVLKTHSQLINGFVKNPYSAIEIIEKCPRLFEINFSWENNEDVLGLLYISCLNTGDRKASGAYYTPTHVVKKLISKLGIEPSFHHSQRILDPCCGTGNFLLQLPDAISIENIYGNDIDKLSVLITRINLALKYQLTDIQIVIENITNNDYLTEFFHSGFDFVIGNPPWGYEYSEEEGARLNHKYITARGKKTESYDVFIEHSLKITNQKGVVSFVLPEAILNVKSHFNIRKLITENTTIQYLEYLGDVFDGVQCPSIILKLLVTNQKISTVGMQVTERGQSFEITRERNVSPDFFSFLMSDNEYSILEKIENASPVEYLANQATFALGIVTGNNKTYISKTKTNENELILKGSDILKYRFVSAQNYITFTPESFQQVAPIEYYRSPEKLLYRFICEQLVFAYDNAQTLSLNSCNILIPAIPGLNIKYVLAILNSRLAQFYFKKKFNSIKVLRSHIEQIPIVRPEESIQAEIISLVNGLLSTEQSKTIVNIYNKIDILISQIYKMTESEYQTICSNNNTENLFLV